MTPTGQAQATSETLPERISEDRRIDRPSAILKGEPSRNSVQAAQRRDHRFFLTMAILGAITVFVGYFPSYYQKPLESVLPLAPSPVLANIIHIHAAVMSTYILFFVMQTALVSVNRKALHMTLGWASVILIPMMVILGTVAVFYGAKLGHRGIWPDPEIAAAINIFDGYVYAILAAVAILLRATPQVHKRLMFYSLVCLIAPAIARSPAIRFGPAGIAIVVFTFLLAGPVYDQITRRRIHPAYLWSLPFIIATMPPTRLALGHTQAWHHFVDWVIAAVN
jgi:hypothetical protein